MASAHVTFGRRAAWREGLKALGAPPQEVKRFLSETPSDDLDPEARPNLDLLPRSLRGAAPIAPLAGENTPSG